MNQQTTIKKKGLFLSLLYKYPRTVVATILCTSLTIFFSKPVYDIFSSEPIDLSEIPQKYKSKLSHKD